eukprot:Lithocolla_globosa_v1_NODE_7788_length_900_cov_9.216568.p1 type:complete len:267 gc:universal NODE_7788_length_900_cov_9.216568:37-837(+)
MSTTKKITPAPPTPAPPQTPELRKEVLQKTLVSFLLCSCCHFISKKALQNIPHSLLSPADILAFPNKVVSTIHGVTLGLLACKLVFLEKLWKKDVILPYSFECDTLFAGILGNALYDVLLMSFRKEPIAMWMHHLITMQGCFAITYFRQAAFFPVAFAITEVTILPTNILWVFDKFKFKDTRQVLFHSVLLFRLITYMVIRCFTVPLIVAHTTRVENMDNFWKKVETLHWFIPFATCLNMSVMGSLNFYWTYKMLQSYSRIMKEAC